MHPTKDRTISPVVTGVTWLIPLALFAAPPTETFQPAWDSIKNYQAPA